MPIDWDDEEDPDIEQSIVTNKETEYLDCVREQIKVLERVFSILSGANVRDESYGYCLKILCYISDSNPSNPIICQLLKECSNAARVFLYNDMNKTQNASFRETTYFGIVEEYAKAYYTTSNGLTLTKEQKQLFDLFQENRRIAISAPTSFGKSRMVYEIIWANQEKYKNVAIILPTLALISENYLRFKNSRLANKYNIVNSIRQIRNDSNIFILTPERMVTLLDEIPELRFELVVMDEIYKLQNDSRSNVFSFCLYQLLKRTKDIYLIGPYFRGISKKLLEKTGAVFHKFSTEIVQKNVVDVYNTPIGEVYSTESGACVKAKGNDTNLKRLLDHCIGQTLVYSPQKYNAEILAKKIAGWSEVDLDSSLINYIANTYSEDWSLVKCLKKGIAFHHAAVPKYILTEIVEEFNVENSRIRTIVCTPTLMEGVNTTAKNVIITAGKKADEDLSGFDVKNLKGRAGRLNVHFLGNVYVLAQIPQEEEKAEIEFMYYDSSNIPGEDLIHIDTDDLKMVAQKKKLELLNRLNELAIPVELVKVNKFVDIEKQISFIHFLRNNGETFDSDSSITREGIPLKQELSIILNYISNFLLTDSEKEKIARRHGAFDVGFGILKQRINYYVYEKPTIQQFIKCQAGKTVDTQIRNAFSYITNYFEFLLPKYLMAVSNLYNFVAQEKGWEEIHLDYVISILQYGFVEKHNIALKDAGVPNDIIRKVGKHFDGCQDIVDIRETYKHVNLEKLLNPIELRIFNRYI